MMPFGLAAAGGSIISGLINAGAAGSAAKTQADAQSLAAGIQGAEFLNTQQNLQPFIYRGGSAFAGLGGLLGIDPQGNLQDPSTSQLLSNPRDTLMPTLGGPPTIGLNKIPYNTYGLSNFQASPGYNYILGQTSDAIQNSAGVKTGAVSGNMLKALQSNAEGLASQDWWNQYNAYANDFWKTQDVNNQTYWNTLDAQTQNQLKVFNMLNSLGQTGANAAAGLGNTGAQVSANIGSNIVGGGQNIAAGQLGATNAITGGFNSAIQNLAAGGTNPLSFLFGPGAANFSGDPNASNFSSSQGFF